MVARYAPAKTAILTLLGAPLPEVVELALHGALLAPQPRVLSREVARVRLL